MSLKDEKFIRRFLLHVLPAGFVRIRYYGLLANRHRTVNLAQCRELLGAETTAESATTVSAESEAWQARLARLTGKDPTLCPHCGRGHLRRVEDLEPALRSSAAERSPP